jgi:protoporphyrinogen/coproporphyrinogen III oxidase
MQHWGKGFVMDGRVAIVGGGISGLIAGYTLKQAGISYDIFEKSAFPGGRMSSETVNGCIIDKGAYTVPEFYNGLNRFLKELDLSNQLVKTPSTSSTYLNGKAYNIKIGSPIDLLRYKLLSAKSKMDLVQIGLYARSLGKAPDISRPSKKSFDWKKN